MTLAELWAIFPIVKKNITNVKILNLLYGKKFEHNRDGYTEAKGEFVKKYTTLAKEYFKKVTKLINKKYRLI